MKAIIILNNSELIHHDFLVIGADFFYCLFEVNGMYVENESHFYFPMNDNFNSLNKLVNSIKNNQVKNITMFEGKYHSYASFVERHLNNKGYSVESYQKL